MKQQTQTPDTTKQKELHTQGELKRYQTSISFTYDAESPQDAVKQFLANIPLADWYVDVKDIATGKQYAVDSETWEMQTLGNE